MLLSVSSLSVLLIFIWTRPYNSDTLALISHSCRKRNWQEEKEEEEEDKSPWQFLKISKTDKQTIRKFVEKGVKPPPPPRTVEKLDPDDKKNLVDKPEVDYSTDPNVFCLKIIQT